jgi:hypothetical protein
MPCEVNASGEHVHLRAAQHRCKICNSSICGIQNLKSHLAKCRQDQELHSNNERLTRSEAVSYQAAEPWKACRRAICDTGTILE